MAKDLILVVDDDEALRAQLERAFSARGLRVMTAGNFGEVANCLDRDLPDLAVIDLKMPRKSGLEVLQLLRDRSPATRAIVLTGYGSIANAVEAVRLGAVDYVTKPADADQILLSLTGDETRGDSEEFQRASLAETEWNHIQKVLADCDGNITHAAKILDIPRRTLQRKLKKRAP